MEKREIPFSPPDITDLEIAEVIRTLKSGWITTGPRTKEFERKIAAYCGTKRAAALYKALKKTEKYMAIRYDYIEEILPKDIFFITSQELLDLYPDLTPKEREDRIVRENPCDQSSDYDRVYV